MRVYLTLLNCTRKNDEDDKFYVINILQLKPLKKHKEALKSRRGFHMQANHGGISAINVREAGTNQRTSQWINS